MTRELPTGEVTLVFTDIEGSTRLLHELGAEAYAEMLAEHRRVLREAFRSRGGVEVDTQGDAFFYAFASAAAATEAAVDGREALRSGPIHVRVGIHTGTPHLTDEATSARTCTRARGSAQRATAGRCCSRRRRAGPRSSRTTPTTSANTA